MHQRYKRTILAICFVSNQTSRIIELERILFVVFKIKNDGIGGIFHNFGYTRTTLLDMYKISTESYQFIILANPAADGNNMVAVGVLG